MAERDQPLTRAPAWTCEEHLGVIRNGCSECRIAALEECMQKAGLVAFMRGRPAEEIAEHLRDVIDSYVSHIAALEQQLAKAVADREVLARFFAALDEKDPVFPETFAAHAKQTAERLDLHNYFGDLTETGERLAELGFAAEQRAAGGAE